MFITIRQANNLTGKAEITIRRLIKKAKKDPETTQMIKQNDKKQYLINAEYLLKEFNLPMQLISQIDQSPAQMSSQKNKQTTQMSSQDEQADYSNDKSKDNKTNQKSKQENKQTKQKTNQMSSQMSSQLDNQIVKTLNSTIEVLKDQLTVKDNQIQDLSDAQKRSDVLLGQMQNRLLLLEGEVKEVKTEKGTSQTIDAKPVKDKKQAKSKPKNNGKKRQKKEGLFSWLLKD